MVCVDDSSVRGFIKKDEIYTVNVYEGNWHCGIVSVSIIEVPGISDCVCNRCGAKFKGFIGFKPYRFRPISQAFADQSDFDLWKIEQEIEKEQSIPIIQFMGRAKRLKD